MGLYDPVSGVKELKGQWNWDKVLCLFDLTFLLRRQVQRVMKQRYERRVLPCVSGVGTVTCTPSRLQRWPQGSRVTTPPVLYAREPILQFLSANQFQVVFSFCTMAFKNTLKVYIYNRTLLYLIKESTCQDAYNDCLNLEGWQNYELILKRSDINLHWWWDSVLPRYQGPEQ